MAGGNVKNYLSNPKSSFFALEDDEVDDEEFLKNSRRSVSNNTSNINNGYSQYTSQSNSTYFNSQPNDDLEQRRMQLLDKKREIEERSLLSTERSLDLLIESEEVGRATAEELKKQREQLERTEKNLDNINTTLRFTQKNIDGIKSVFGSIKNYLTKKDQASAGASSAKDPPITPIDRNTHYNESKSPELLQSQPLSPTSHPAMTLRGFSNDSRETYAAGSKIDHNLDMMAYSITNLKGLATNLGEEIISQNDLVDQILYKSDKADLNINKQNKEINRLLKK